MNREEILAKSRQEQYDEGAENAENKGRSIGYIAFILLFVVILIFSFFTGQTTTCNALQALFWIFMAAQGYSRYQFTKEKKFLVCVIAASIASICFVISYILGVLG